MGFEPTTTCLGSKDSTTELQPPYHRQYKSLCRLFCQDVFFAGGASRTFLLASSRGRDYSNYPKLLIAVEVRGRKGRLGVGFQCPHPVSRLGARTPL